MAFEISNLKSVPHFIDQTCVVTTHVNNTPMDIQFTIC